MWLVILIAGDCFRSCCCEIVAEVLRVELVVLEDCFEIWLCMGML